MPTLFASSEKMFNESRLSQNDSIGKCSSELYSFNLLKLPPPPRAAILVYNMSKLLLVKLDNPQININSQNKTTYQHTNAAEPCFSPFFLNGCGNFCRGILAGTTRPRMYQKTKQVFPSVPPLSCESPRIPDSENGPRDKIRTSHRNHRTGYMSSTLILNHQK